MFENLTYEELLKEKLKMIDSSMDKRQGSIIYDTLAPNSAESVKLYMNMDMLINRTFADTATGNDLDRRVWERNIVRKSATNAIVKAKFYDENSNVFNITEGDRFSGGGNDYYAADKIADGQFKLICEKAGEIGNEYTGKILPVNYIEGLMAGEITDIIVYGENEENDESLRERYIDSFNTKAFGGNIDDYKRLLKQIDGVGGSKIYPAYYGGGTVRAVVINNGYDAPEDLLITEIQQYVDPVPKGSGTGAVPIGHSVTVEGTKGEEVNIVFSLTISEGYDEDFVVEQARNNIEEYFLELRKNWENEEELTVRISHIETRIIDVKGIIDVANIRLNGNNSNIIIASDMIPVLGTVVNQ